MAGELAFTGGGPLGDTVVPPPPPAPPAGATSRVFTLTAAAVNGQVLPKTFTLSGTFDRKYLVAGYDIVAVFTYTNIAHSLSFDAMNVGAVSVSITPFPLTNGSIAESPGSLGFFKVDVGSVVTVSLSGNGNDPITGSITITLFLVASSLPVTPLDTAPVDLASPILLKLAEHGVLGIVVVVLLVVLRAVYQELKDERAGRLGDAARYSDKLLQLSDRVHDTTDQLTKTADALIDIARKGQSK